MVEKAETGHSEVLLHILEVLEVREDANIARQFKKRAIGFGGVADFQD